ncbi:MAG: vWA domain-containing protein [Patescibacteria group bacterium]
MRNMKNEKKRPAPKILSRTLFEEKSRGLVSKLFSRAMLDENMRGFTLIEVLIAVMILALAVAAAVIVERTSLRSDSLHRHRFQATGLAQQGLNLARSIRDTNVIGGATGTDIWNNLGGVDPISGQAYKLQQTGSQWEIIPDNNGEDFDLNGINFNRKFYIENFGASESEIIIEHPIDLLYLFDISNSMNNTYAVGEGSKLQAAKSAINQLNNAIAQNSSNSRVGMITFNGGITEGFFCNEVTPTYINVLPPGTSSSIFTSNISELNNNVANLSASGSTPTALAIKRALDWSQGQWNGNHIPIVILISDGVPTIDLATRSYSDADVQAISLYDANHNFLSSDVVKTSGGIDCGSYYNGIPLSNVMDMINSFHNKLPEVAVYSVAIQAVAGGIFNNDIMEYIADSGGGQSYEALNTSALVNVLEGILNEAVNIQNYFKKVKAVITWDEYGKTQTLELWTYLKDVE